MKVIWFYEREDGGYWVLHGHPEAPPTLHATGPGVKLRSGHPEGEFFSDIHQAMERALALGLEQEAVDRFLHEHGHEARMAKVLEGDLDAPFPENPKRFQRHVDAAGVEWVFDQPRNPDGTYASDDPATEEAVESALSWHLA